MEIDQIQKEYDQLRSRLARLGWMTQGHVWDRGRGGNGPRYQWTGKFAEKTRTVALSQEQYVAFKEANQTWREAQEILKRMTALSRHFILTTFPNPPRRKALIKKRLSLI